MTCVVMHIVVVVVVVVVVCCLLLLLFVAVVVCCRHYILLLLFLPRVVRIFVCVLCVTCAWSRVQIFPSYLPHNSNSFCRSTNRFRSWFVIIYLFSDILKSSKHTHTHTHTHTNATGCDVQVEFSGERNQNGEK